MVKRVVKAKVILLVVLGILVIASYAECADWWNEDYQYRMKLTFDNSDSSEDLTNFPVLVHLTSTHSSFWSHINNSITTTNTRDLRFVDSNNSNELYFEVEKIDYNGKDALIWVKVPQIDSGSESDNIYVYYGNSSATQTNYHNAEDVWDTNFRMVQHLNESPDDGVKGHYDSTSYDNDGTPKNFETGSGTTDATGQIDGADEFDGVNDHVNCGNDPSLKINDEITIEAWVKPDVIPTDGSYDVVLGKSLTAAPYTSYKFSLMWNKIYLTIDAGGAVQQITYKPTQLRWYHIVGTYDGSYVRLYVDGVERGTKEASGSRVCDTSIVYIGSITTGGSHKFDGTIDEVRVSATGRSADWIEASYLNQKEGSTYVIYGSEENTYTPSASISLRPYSPVRQGNVDLTLTTSGDVATPSLYYTPKGKSRIKVGLSGSGSTYHGRLTITNTTGDGLAIFSYEGEDQYGNKGTVITQGGTFRIDTKAPTATLTLSQEEPVGIGKLTVTCTLSEGVHPPPELRYTPQGKSPIKINLLGNENVWTGEITITNTTGDGEAKFSFSATDRAGNKGTTITGGETFIIKTMVEKGEIEERIVADIDDPKTKIIIPSGALKENIRMYLTKKEKEDVPSLDNREPLLAYEFKAKDEDYEQIKDLTFKKRVKIVLHYERSLVKSEDENKLCIYYYDGFLWQRIPSKVDKLAATVTGFIDHCTLFALFISESPVKVKCRGATPNPFTPNGDGINDTTKFNVHLPQDMEIKEINVYDVRGRLIRTIEDGFISWDGKDQFGDKCAGGLYIFQVKTEEGIVSGTVTLIR